MSPRPNPPQRVPPRQVPLLRVPVGDTDRFTPSRHHLVRLRARTMQADTHFEPHAHAWAQLAYCATGVVKVTAQRFAGDDAAGEVTYIVPPSRAVWIAPGALHQITVLEAAEFRTLYIHAAATPRGWKGCRVLMVSPLLRESVHALDGALAASQPDPAREKLLTQLVLDELARADTQALGVPMPHPRNGDKRLRALCEAILRAPGAHATLAAWTANIGASERTMTRLFRDELGMSYQQWRQQAVLAHALPLLTSGQSVSAVAAASGYASDSAFSAMFRAAMGQSPSHFQGRNVS
ncbi:helix-turn-helix transcriptional regulator [Polaromonas sp. YR568]|uniref:AraC family transcriptional regulator n=1 Tax=Polaromonas sp. YR568 TaxID=1855301 RepID=UPI003137DF7B